MRRRPSFFLLLVLVAVLTMAGCNRQSSLQIDYRMGEKVTDGPLIYTVVESTWKTQLGNLFHTRLPEQRFMLITISVTNSGGREVSVPLLTLRGTNGKEFLEVGNGEDVDNWFGLLRTIGPAQTQQGRILFDVPLSSYKLRLTDGGDAGAEKYAWVDIPLSMDTDTSVDAPAPGSLSK